MKARNIVILLVVILLIASLGFVVFHGVPIGVYDFEPIDGIQLGLDLTGGVSIVYEAADQSQEDLELKIQGAMGIFRNRLDSKGFTEATITRQGAAGIRVEVPINSTSEISDPAEIVQFVGTPAKLEFIDPENNVVLLGSDISVAEAVIDNSGAYIVQFELTSEGTDKFADATAKWKGQVISIYLDGVPISRPTVNDVIASGSGSISGNFTAEEAVNLAMQIESGALPLELDILEQRTIESTLGDDALNKSILAGIIGLIILMIFMIVVYRLPGIMADIALTSYIVIVLFCISLFEIQLTLPGIAGIILGIGMAVDANVIIFERFKEEFRAGRTLRESLKFGYSKAATAIIDSNITTLIAAIVLAIFGTGSIKGFAFTLIISIVASLITALLISKGLLKLIIGICPNGKRLYVPIKKNKEA